MGVINGLRYPEPTDAAANGALAMRQLAEDVNVALDGRASDAELAALDARVTGLWQPHHVVSSTATVSAGTTGAVIILTGAGHDVTVPLRNGERYRVTATGQIKSTVAGDQGRLRLYAAGSQVRSSGAIPMQSTPVGYPFAMEAYVNGAGADVRFQLGIERLSGTGTVTTQAGSNDPVAIVVESLGRL